MSDYWHQSYPTFPSDVPTAKLSKLCLQKLISTNEEESQRLWESCQTSGFFLLDLRGSPEGDLMLRDVGKMFRLAGSLFGLDTDTKMKYGLRNGTAYGYKGIGFSKVDNKGTPDRCEFWGISKDDIIGVSKPEEVPDVLDRSRTALHSFVEHAHFICMLILSHLNKHLHLAPGTLAALHELHRSSTDQVRLLKMPPQPEGDRRTSLLPHTDFGSVTLVWNILGGLQIQRPEARDNEECWEFVKPEPGCAIVNMGDAMVKFTNGIIRSNLHRVAYAPGEQAIHDRYSLAYFSRPSDNVLMKALPEALPAGENKSPSDEHAKEPENGMYTMREWVVKRTELYRKGGEQMRSNGGRANVAVAVAK